MPSASPIDAVARGLAEWVMMQSKQIAESIKGGMTAPGAQKLSEQQKLEYYTRQFFNADGSPNQSGRASEITRLGPVAFAETYQEVIHAHPELAPQSPEAPEAPEAASPAANQVLS